jgi:hypothetical protein
MSQERLNGLVILSIEQDLLENTEYKSLISNFIAESVYRVIFQPGPPLKPFKQWLEAPKIGKAPKF